MKQLMNRTLLAVLLTIQTAVACGGDYDEAVNGEISGSTDSPTAWTLSSGANILKGSAGTTDYDLLTLTLGPNHRLDSLVLNSHQIAAGRSFIALQASPTWMGSTGQNVNPNMLIGWELFQPSDAGKDLLPSMMLQNLVPNFDPTLPLNSGTYTLLLQDTGSSFSYQFTLNVSEVPEPASLALGALGLFSISRLSRRRGK